MGIAFEAALHLAKCVCKFSIGGNALTLGKQDILLNLFSIQKIITIHL